MLDYNDIKIAEEDKCIMLLCSSLDSWENMNSSFSDNLVGTLKMDNVIATLWSTKGSKATLHVNGRSKERRPNNLDQKVHKDNPNDKSNNLSKKIE